MQALKKTSISLLAAANVALFSFMVVPSSIEAHEGDFCEEGSLEHTGCGCLAGSPWYPDGCYGHSGTNYDCTNAYGCP
jgi:hypothetical protein